MPELRRAVHLIRSWRFLRASIPPPYLRRQRFCVKRYWSVQMAVEGGRLHFEEFLVAGTDPVLSLWLKPGSCIYACISLRTCHGSYAGAVPCEACESLLPSASK